VACDDERMISRTSLSVFSVLSAACLVATTVSCANVTRRDDGRSQIDGAETESAGGGETTSGPDHGATSAGGASDDASSGGKSPDPPCAGAISWLDAHAIERSRTRFVDPELTGDHDGFLFVTTERVPDVCEAQPCVRVERFASSGDAKTATRAAFAPTSDRIRLFAGTDHTGAGHFAAAMNNGSPEITGAMMAEEIVWGAGTQGAEQPARRTVDPARGLGTVAFDADGAWILMHGWEVETGWGEGYSYPVAPELEHVAEDGSVTTVDGLDPTAGELFHEPRIALSDRGPWLATRSFMGPVRAAGPDWSGLLDDHATHYAVVAQRSGALVVVRELDGVTEIARIGVDGTRVAGPPLAPSLPGATVALATDGANVVLAHGAASGELQVTTFDASLAITATGTVPGTTDLGQWPRVRVAAATDGTFAVLVTRFPSEPDQDSVPVAIRRFQRCE
jgi:hypothetical protein